MKRVIQIIAAVVLFSTLAVADVGQQVTYRWTAPTTGTAVVSYEVEMMAAPATTFSFYAEVSDTTITITQLYDVSTSIRVRGKDAHNRVGPWSQPSDPFTVVGPPPGACGKPQHDPVN